MAPSKNLPVPPTNVHRPARVRRRHLLRGHGLLLPEGAIAFLDVSHAAGCPFVLRRGHCACAPTFKLVAYGAGLPYVLPRARRSA